ncbi:MAG: hypothetical protein IH598_00005, partial [Bacteroidales bacterium]|nr:hypothetical protein [Bacteroidales bacterium]
MKKFIFLLMMIIGIQIIEACVSTNDPDKFVQGVYHLRMNGKMDDAKAALEFFMKKDSLNAQANYEMARLSHYMLLGGSQVEIEAISQSINKAVEADPENVIYAYYKGIVSF